MSDGYGFVDHIAVRLDCGMIGWVDGVFFGELDLAIGLHLLLVYTCIFFIPLVLHF